MTSLPMSPASWEDRVAIVRRHFEDKGYRVHSGLQFGCELVLYADTPDRVHSDFCVHVVPPDGTLDWKLLQSLVRSMPDLHKTLIVAHLVQQGKQPSPDDDDDDTHQQPQWQVQEMAIATEHAPFRHKKNTVQVGGQKKKPKHS
jgi:tRNA intron endonuclease, catalytic C-terminal domain